MLETSEREFTARFAAYAAQGLLYPQSEGSPLMEFSSGGRVLYLFDRLGPYLVRPGAARVVVHGVLDLAGVQVLGHPEEPEETLTVLGIGAAEGQGQIVAQERGVWVVQARLPLVLAAFEPLPQVEVGDWVTFRTVPPMHGFLVSQTG